MAAMIKLEHANRAILAANPAPDDDDDDGDASGRPMTVLAPWEEAIGGSQAGNPTPWWTHSHDRLLLRAALRRGWCTKAMWDVVEPALQRAKERAKQRAKAVTAAAAGASGDASGKALTSAPAPPAALASASASASASAKKPAKPKNPLSRQKLQWRLRKIVDSVEAAGKRFSGLNNAAFIAKVLPNRVLSIICDAIQVYGLPQSFSDLAAAAVQAQASAASASASSSKPGTDIPFPKAGAHGILREAPAWKVIVTAIGAHLGGSGKAWTRALPFWRAAAVLMVAMVRHVTKLSPTGASFQQAGALIKVVRKFVEALSRNNKLRLVRRVDSLHVLRCLTRHEVTNALA